jgi:hypothetical protein
LLVFLVRLRKWRPIEAACRLGPRGEALTAQYGYFSVKGKPILTFCSQWLSGTKAVAAANALI